MAKLGVGVSLVLASSLISNCWAGMFPDGFKWCVATAAHQIEGYNVDSDWWDWEQEAGHIKNGARSGRACDHWNRVEEDIELLTKLHVDAYRFSIEWAKIEPAPGEWNFEAAEHYYREIEALRKRGISPLVTLQHFTLPRWIREKGGWAWEDTPHYFARFAKFAVKVIGPQVSTWMTVNEPMVNLVLGYMGGVQPPGLKGEFKDVMPPLRGLLKSHALAYAALHKYATRPIRVGIVHHLRVFDPANRWNPLDRYLAYRMDHAFNWSIGDAIESGRLRISMPLTIDINEDASYALGTQDFIGVNYYTRDMVAVKSSAPGFELSVPKGADVSDVGWEIYPEGFYRILKDTAQHFPGKSIFITENGIADSQDTKRTKFLETHLLAVAKAIHEGVPVEGYCHWSLYDNFEWSEGFGPRFGLFEMNYETMERRPRQSAKRFSEIAAKNSL